MVEHDKTKPITGRNEMENLKPELYNLVPGKTIFFIDITGYKYPKYLAYELIPYTESVKNIKYVFYGDRYKRVLFGVYEVKRFMKVEPKDYPMILNMPCVALQNSHWVDDYKEIALLQYSDETISLAEMFFGDKGVIPANWCIGGMK